MRKARLARPMMMNDRFVAAKRCSGLTLILIAILLVGSKAPAQMAAGTIVGVVSDSSGAVIPGAQVSLTDVDKNQTIRVKTGNAGYYSFPQLLPDRYRVTVEISGYKTFVQETFKLDVATTLTINATLQIGDATETITVTTAPPLLETQTSSLGQVLENHSVVDLPLNGRNAYGFAGLVPGVIASIGFTQPAFDEYADQFISINGSRPNQNIFLLDGGINSEPAFSGPGYFPSVDLVQEYKVQTNNQSAEFTNSGGGVVNVVTKSGSNEIHGSTWEFFRSQILAANDFFSNRAGLPRAGAQFNQFGVTAGGPIRKNKTFFFFGYEGLRWLQAGSAVGTLPTAAQRTGDFSSTFNSNGQMIPIYDPYSTKPDPNKPGQFIRTQFTGNKIPTSEIDQVAQNLLTFLPLPNRPGNPFTGNNNYLVNFDSEIDENSFSLRVDQAITQKQRIFGRFSINDTPHQYPNAYGNSPNFLISVPNANQDFYREQQTTVDYTYTLSQDAILDLNSSYMRYSISRISGSNGIGPSTVGFPSYFSSLPQQSIPCFPTVTVSGMTTVYSPSTVGGGFMGNCALLGDTYPNLLESGSVTFLHGRHTFKAGADFGMAWLSTPRYRTTSPSFSFTPSFTQGPNPVSSTNSGVSLASFLLGTGTGSIGSGGPYQYLSSRSYGIYFQDDWRVNSKLTLNLGVRYDFTTPWLERYNRFTDWNSTATSPLQVSSLGTIVGGLEFPGVSGVPRSEFNSFKKGVAPRVGLAFAVTPKTTFRGGYGLFYAPINGFGFNGNAVPNTGFLSTTTMVGTLDGVTPLNTLSNPFPNGFALPTNSSLGLGTLIGQTVVGMDRHRPVSYAEQWNVDLQRQFGAWFLLDVAYAGSHGVHLYSDYNPDQLPDKYLSMGSGLNAQVSNPFFGQINAGSLSKSTVAESQLLRPFPQFSSVTAGNGSFFGASQYNALQVKLERRFANGFNLLASYTWSKLMDNVGATIVSNFPGGSFVKSGTIQDWDNLRGERSLSSIDTPHYLAFNGTYQLPFGTGKAFFNQSKAANYVIGGWQLNGILTLTSGAPLAVGIASNDLFNYGGTQRANWNGKNPSLSGHVSHRLTQYFNTSDFSTPAPFSYGSCPRLLGDLRQPGVINTDLSGLKSVPIHDRISAQFRAEAFNLFNHPLFAAPDTTLGDGNTGVISGLYNSPRQIQLAVKILW